ncbi:hypothetical protein R1flu_020312 [Riccia fluitans]|uniref:Uncharacterized protein n=1 Tax=Riccia fluitans TaxID=41844 RepID=A0ABD1ZL53_9MARC
MKMHMPNYNKDCMKIVAVITFSVPGYKAVTRRIPMRTVLNMVARLNRRFKAYGSLPATNWNTSDGVVTLKQKATMPT